MTGFEGARAMVLTAALLAACHGETPQNLGLHDGKLAPCPGTPNCVSSQATDDGHTVAPLAASVPDCSSAMAAVASAIEAEPRTTFIARNPAYVRVEFTSRIFRFVDDVEVACDPTTHRLDIRSASRLGESDLGVNRARVERLTKALAGKVR
jgi:uncharacterized protein (DUF1499 family)